MLTAAEATVIWLALDVLARLGQRSAIPAWSLLVLVSVASLLPRWLEAAGLWDRAYGTAVLMAVVATTLLVIKTGAFPAAPWLDKSWLRDTVLAIGWWPVEERWLVWIAVLVSAFAWWRGRTRAEPGPDAALTTFRLGTAIMLALVAAHALTGGDTPARGASLAVLAFYGSVLSAIAIARLRPEGERGRLALGARWLGPQLLPVLAVVMAAFGVAAALSPDVLDTALWLLAPLVWALSVVFRFLVIVLAIIAFVLVFPVLWLLSRYPIQVGGIRWSMSPTDPRAWVAEAMGSAADVPGAIRLVAAAGVLVALFSGVTRLALRRRRARQQRDVARTEVLDARDLVELTMVLLRRLRRRRARPADPLAALRGDPQWRHTVAIREIYAAFLRWSAIMDVPRPASRTPSEHARHLLAHHPMPGIEADVIDLTETYASVRYGALPATASDSERVRAAWARLRRNG